MALKGMADGGNCFFRMLVLPLGNDESPQIAVKKGEPRGMYTLIVISSLKLWEGNLRVLPFLVHCLNCERKCTTRTILMY
jgi:hypothetical protein